jgi:uncharacterized lipoprotein YddW (UPF0748 family)
MKKSVRKAYKTCADKIIHFIVYFSRQGRFIFLLLVSLTITIANPFNSYSLQVADLSQSNDNQLCLQENIPREIRGVWLTNIDSDVLFSRQKTKDAIATLADFNFNTVYPTVWNWGYTLYPSSVAEKVTGYSLDPTEGLQKRDILEEIIKQAHKREIAVIPWFEFGFMAPADSELAKRHPDWLTQQRDGSTIWWEGKVHQRVWLNPLHPEVQEFITSLIKELVSNYDIDGIQLDDHFGFPAEFGYDDLTIKLYQEEHEGKLPPEDSEDEEWIRWRADKITSYLEELFHTVKESNSKVIFSLSPNPYEFSLNSFLADWRTWEQKGLIEELVIQVYRSDKDSFLAELKQPEVIAASKHIPVGIGILSGLKGRPVPFSTIKEQVEISRDRGMSGVSFFFYESLWYLSTESIQRRQEAFQALFTETVKRPNIFDCWMVREDK